MLDATTPTLESLSALRLAHYELVARVLEGVDDENQSVETIKAFITQATGAGAFIDDRHDRRDAQCILDYWAAELVSSPYADESRGPRASRLRY